MVEPKLKNNWLWCLFGISLWFSFLLKSGFLFFVGFWSVFSKQFKKLACYRNNINIAVKERFVNTLVLVNSFLKLSKSRRHLQSLKKNSLLTLNTNVLGPSDKSSEISFWLDVSSDSKVFGILLKQWALILCCPSLCSTTGCHYFLALGNFLHLRTNDCYNDDDFDEVLPFISSS